MDAFVRTIAGALARVSDGAAAWREVVRGVRSFVDRQLDYLDTIPWILGGAFVILLNLWIARRLIRMLDHNDGRPRVGTGPSGERKSSDGRRSMADRGACPGSARASAPPARGDASHPAHRRAS